MNKNKKDYQVSVRAVMSKIKYAYQIYVRAVWDGTVYQTEVVKEYRNTLTVLGGLEVDGTVVAVELIDQGMHRLDARSFEVCELGGMVVTVSPEQQRFEF